jgi:thymidylate synthase ThyX
MMTQTAQRLTTRLGHATPRLMAEAGFEAKYEAALAAAAEMYEKLRAFNPDVAQYIVPNACNRRVLARFNLREAYAFCQLRSAPNAHFSMRRIAQRVYEEIRRVHPRLAAYMHVGSETSQGVEEQYFAGC